MHYQRFPALSYDDWENTNQTLHLFLQVVGKIRLYTFPKMNHWWHVPLYVSTKGLTTRPIPYSDGRLFELEFDFEKHNLIVRDCERGTDTISLAGRTVASFFHAVNESLAKMEIEIAWKQPFPYDLPFSSESFATNDAPRTYDPKPVNTFWKILLQVQAAFDEFRGRFSGKSTPPHLFWHHMDLALTFFSGRKAPEREKANIVEQEAYSHEVISFGFWAGDQNVRAPAFYAYASPVPEGLFDQPLRPVEAAWNAEAGMALLMYDDICQTENPKEKILQFLESVYEIGVKTANWDVEPLR